MSVFLESANETSKQKNVNIALMEQNVSKACFEFNEALAYSEIAWQNIVITAMNEEYNILNEAESNDKGKVGKALDAVKNFFKRVIEFVKNLFTKIKNWFSSVYTNLKSGYALIRTFAVKHKAEIIAGGKLAQGQKGKDAVKTVTVNNWIAGGNGILPDTAEIHKIFNIAPKANPKYVHSTHDTFAEVDAALKRLIKTNDKGGTTKVLNLNDRLATSSVRIASTADKELSTIVKAMKDVETKSKELNAKANQGLNANNEDLAAKLKEETTTHKTGLIIRNRAVSAITSLTTKLVKDAHKINVACYKIYKKEKGIVEKNKKKNDTKLFA